MKLTHLYAVCACALLSLGAVNADNAYAQKAQAKKEKAEKEKQAANEAAAEDKKEA